MFRRLFNFLSANAVFCMKQLCAGFRQRQGLILLVRQIGNKNPRWSVSSTGANQLLQERAFQDPTVRPIQRLHQPQRSHPLS